MLLAWTIAIAEAALAIAPPSADSSQSAETLVTVVKMTGTVKSISGKTITLAEDSGRPASVIVQDSTRMLRTAPGKKDLKTATPLQLQDVRAGDRMLVRGKPAAEGILALSIIVMKETDIAQRREQEQSDWQARGTGGLVSSVDPTTGTVTLSMLGPSGKRTVLIKTSHDTIMRRYAPNSVKFEDARPGTLDQIRPGDQLCARGTRSANGGEVLAEEIVSGSFRNIAGTVVSTNPADSTLTVADLATKKPVTVRISVDSHLKRLPPMLATRIAMRLKEGPEAGSNVPEASPSGGPRGRPVIRAHTGEPAEFRHGGATPDLQRILDRVPNITLADLQKGEAVMMVATDPDGGAEPVAITLLTGVEPVLAAAPNGGSAMLLTPWNLDVSPAEPASQ